MKKVSVIVPVYNTEPYLQTCLESLSKQTLGNDLDILLVNDGSTDASGKICEDYCYKYPEMFRTFHKENGGSASARELGFNNAVGEYIIVCDSDDWVEPTMYEDLYRLATNSNSDVAICDFFYNYADGRQCKVKIDYGQPSFSQILHKILINNATCASWNKLIRRQIFIDRNLHWKDGINLAEDALMLLKILTSGQVKVVKTDSCLYHYRRRSGENTYTNNIDFQKWSQLRYVDQWKQLKLDPTKFEKELTVSAIDLAFAYLRTNDTTVPFKQISNNRLSFKRVITAPSPIGKRLIIISYKTLGQSLTRHIINRLYKFIYK
ncbi:MAG: glycosyltransferase [Bacteroides sp.]|nr:glycosyltransferase [Bacteroides sp.]